MQKPSVGRIVHYVLPTPHKLAGAHCAAMIIAVDNDDSVTLQVTKPDGEQLTTVNPPHQDFGAGTAAHEEFGSWHWPERV
jgi:hypothetical protein